MVATKSGSKAVKLWSVAFSSWSIQIAGVVRTSVTSKPLFDIILGIHILSVVLSLFIFSMSAICGIRLSAFGKMRMDSDELDLPVDLKKFYAPGKRFMPRVLYIVPASGIVLVMLAHQRFSAHEVWIMVGIGLFLISAIVAERLVWSLEREIQSKLRDAQLDLQSGRTSSYESIWHLASVAGRCSVIIIAFLVVATVFMVVQP